jgi:ubiquitin C
MNNISTVLVNTPRDAIQEIMGLHENEKLIILKSLEGLPMIMKYVAGKTKAKNILNCLKHKIKYSYFDGSKIHEDLDFKMSFSLIHNNKAIKKTDLNKDLSKIGIEKDVEVLNLRKDTLYSSSGNSNKKQDLRDPLTILKMIERRKRRVGGSQIFIKSLTGKTITLGVPQDVTIEEIKYMFNCEESVPLDQQRLIYGGLQLENGKKFSDYLESELISEKTIHIVLRLRGGMYNEVSGRDGTYMSLKNVLDQVWFIDSDFEESKEEECVLLTHK